MMHQGILYSSYIIVLTFYTPFRRYISINQVAASYVINSKNIRGCHYLLPRGKEIWGGGGGEFGKSLFIAIWGHAFC